MLGMEAQVTQKTADGMAAGSGAIATATWIVDIAPYMTVGATLIAIIAGVTAAWFHVEKALDMRRKRLGESKK